LASLPGHLNITTSILSRQLALQATSVQRTTPRDRCEKRSYSNRQRAQSSPPPGSRWKEDPSTDDVLNLPSSTDSRPPPRPVFVTGRRPFDLLPPLSTSCVPSHDFVYRAEQFNQTLIISVTTHDFVSRAERFDQTPTDSVPPPTRAFVTHRLPSPLCLSIVESRHLPILLLPT
jgi:hypothetical protein